MKTEEKTQVSAVGFEPGTFRSCVAHSIHYATETPPIPDVLLVLVVPKYINRNVTTTLQSRFTPTPPHTLELYYYYIYFFFFFFIFFFFIIIFFLFLLFLFFYFFYIFYFFILFYFILFYFILFYFILFYFILFYFILFYFILFYFL